MEYQTASIIPTMTPKQKTAVKAAIGHIHQQYSRPGAIASVDFKGAVVQVTRVKDGETLKSKRAFQLRTGKRDTSGLVVYYAGKEAACAGSPAAKVAKATTSASKTTAK